MFLKAKDRFGKTSMFLAAALLIPMYLMATDTDEELAIESWMSTPFEVSLEESEVGVEYWMTTPFEMEFSEAEMPFEAWMAIPFEDKAVEEQLVVESWMTEPFVTGLADPAGFGSASAAESLP
jgi:hypothetical protein